ncbi:MAG TPA: AI-2E family transporter [Polyangiaceae bacterium]|nr:AI-2E family transporter [Polyangiaceae bacterium]
MMTDSPIPASGSGTGWTRSRVVFLAVSGVLALGVLVLTSEILLPFLLAVLTAYVLTPAVALCEKRLRLPRGLSIILVYAVTIGALYSTGAAIFPRIFTEMQSFVRETPAMARRLAAQWAPMIERRTRDVFDQVGDAPPEPADSAAAFQVEKAPDGTVSVKLGAGVDIVQEGPKLWRLRAVRPRSDKFSIAALVSDATAETAGYVRRNALELIRIGHVIVAKIAHGIFLTFMTLMVAAYLMYTREGIIEFFRSLPPPRSRLGFDRLLFRIDRGFSGVVRGQLIIMVMNGILSAIGYWMFGLKYWPVLALVSGLMSIVPIFGSILSSVPVVMVGLTQNFWTALWVLLWILGIHQVEANILNPKIIGVAAKLHPVLVIFSLLVGEHFYGIWGALLAVPTLSLAQSFFNHFRFESLPDAPPDSVILQTSRQRIGPPAT